MGGRWRLSRFNLRMVLSMVMLLVLHQSLGFCWSLNEEGLSLLKFRERVERDPYGALSNWNEKDGDADPCCWFGVQCSDGKVVVLDLKDLCLEGTLAPELGRLSNLKSIILRNNSFSGSISKEIIELKELEVLDLGFNNFSGLFPADLNNLSLTTLLLDNNQFLHSISPELYELKLFSEVQADESQLCASCSSRHINRNMPQPGHMAHRMLLQETAGGSNSHKSNHHNKGNQISPAPLPFHSSLPPSESPISPSFASSGSRFLAPSSSFSPSPSPSESPTFSPAESSSSLPPSPSPSPVVSPTQAPANPPSFLSAPPQTHEFLITPASSPSFVADNTSKGKHRMVLVAGIVGGSLLVLISAIGVFFFRSSRVVSVKPWATGLSGQLQKAFVIGVPKLKRSELEVACEDFSNIIGSFSDGTVYKGTLSSGVEIAVTSTAVKSSRDWSTTLEAQFRNKIDTLSKVNHKNFVNLIGYCEEDEPFTRMMVFEYAPNGTLFEHLHIKEAEHLDWGMRLRIAMGMAYCLDYMHQLTPPVAHKNLQSSSVYLTEDYAAKITDFSFWNNVTAAKMGPASMQLLESPSADPDSNVYSFGLILLEMITGRIPQKQDNGSVAEWALDYLRGEQPLKKMVDPTLKSFQEDELKKLLEVVKICIHPDPKQRPTMREIAANLKEVTALGPDGATPKLSPLWWAELEILSTEGS